MTRMQVALAALLLPTLVVASGCDDETTGPDTTYDAEYILVEVNGEAPPAKVVQYEDDNGVFDVVAGAGTLSLKSERYTISIAFTLEYEGSPAFSQTWTLSGPFEIDGSTITFESDVLDDGAVTGTISDRRITFHGAHETFGDLSLAFEKE